MKKLGTLSMITAAMVLSAGSAQAAEQVRPGVSTVSVVNTLPAGARISASKSRKNVSMMASNGAIIGSVAAGGALVGLIWAVSGNGNGNGNSPGN